MMRSIVEEALERAKTESGQPQNNSDLDAVLKSLVTKIAVIGCGGAGSNTITRMKDEGIAGTTLYAVNTDAMHLATVKADQRILIGRQRTRGLGAGSYPQVGEEAALESEHDIRKAVGDADMVFVTCGLGGGTGTGCIPVVAKAAHEDGALTIAIVTLPFSSEGVIRMENAEAGLAKLREVADTVIVVPNDRLMEVVPKLPLAAAFKVADEILMRAVKGITELITVPGLVNLDFADIRAVMEKGGVAMIGMGESDAQNKAADAVGKAIRSPLLEIDISGATSALVNVTGGNDMTMAEAEGVVEEVSTLIDPDARIIWGAQIDPSMQNTIRVLLIMTGVRSPQIYARNEKSNPQSHKLFEIDFLK